MALSRPKYRRAESYPVIPLFRQFSRKAEIDGILNEHAFGSFARPSMLADELMTDDRISGTIETRIGALLSADLEIRPARDSRKERKLAEQLGGIDDSNTRGLWPSIVPPAAAFDLLKWGYLIGLAVAQIVWDQVEDQWVPRLCPWHPRHLRWDWSTRRLMIQTSNMGELALPDYETQPGGDGNWFVWAPHGLVLGWLNGMVRSLSNAYLGRQWNFRDWARYNEKHGMAILKALTPAWAKPKDTSEWLESLSTLGSESAINCPQSQKKDEAGFGLELVEAQARTWESFKEFKSSLDTDIAIRVLGQNLTTEGGTDGGSRALGQVHDLVRLDKAIEDAGIGDAFSRQIIRPWAARNYGDPELAPSVVYHVEPAADLAKTALGWKTLGEAGQALKTAEPRSDIPAIFEAEGIPLMTEEQLAEQQAAAAQRQADQQQPQDGTSDVSPEDMADIQKQLSDEAGQPVEITSAKQLSGVIAPAGESPGAGDAELPLLDEDDWRQR